MSGFATFVEPPSVDAGFTNGGPGAGGAASVMIMSPVCGVGAPTRGGAGGADDVTITPPDC